MLNRQTLIDGTKMIQHNMQKIDLKFLSPRTIVELAENRVLTLSCPIGSVSPSNSHIFAFDMPTEFIYSAARINQLIGEEWKARQLTRDSIIYKLGLLGLGNEEIGLLFDMTEGGVRKIRTKLNTEFSTIPKQF